MTSYRRDETSSRAHAKKNRRNRSGQTRGFHQDQDQVNSHSGIPGNQYTSDYHGDVPPSPASSAPAFDLNDCDDFSWRAREKTFRHGGS